MTVSKLINKKVIFFILIVIPVFVLGAICSHFASKSFQLSSQFRNKQDEYVKLAKEKKELTGNYSNLNEKYVKLQNDYAGIEGDLRSISQERENLLRLVKTLSAESERAKELQSSLENLKKELKILEKERLETIEQNLILRDKVKNIQDAQKRLIKERDELTQTLETERAKSFVKKLEEDKASLQKENKDLIDRLKQLQSEYISLKEQTSKTKQELDKAVKEDDALKERLKKLNDDYAQAVNKNRNLEQKVSQMPKKFAEIARQNKVLIKRTANMHYNLGVFYTKQKEYTRAVTEFENALELTPDDAYVHFNLGFIYAEHLVNRPKAIEHFRQYLRLAKKDDKDIDWVRKYILTWESWQGNKPME